MNNHERAVPDRSSPLFKKTIMKRSIIVCLMAAVLFGLSGCKDKGRIVEPKEGPAHLVVKPQEIFLGVVNSSDDVIQKDILLINEGSENLVISDVENLCHCTHAEFPDRPIRPGHGERLKVYLNVNALPPGQFSRTVIVHSNGGEVAIDFTGEKLNQ